MRIFTLVLALCFQLFSAPSIALIHGKETPSLEVSTVQLQINHHHWLRSVNSWDEYESQCSGVIVGKSPLTILTAAHCLKEAKIDHESFLPSLAITNQNELGIHYAKLIKAFYHSFDEVEKNLAQDVAVLVFDAGLSDKVTFIPVQKGKISKQVLVCGYGSGYKEVELQNPRCSQKNVLTNLKDFYQIMPREYEETDQMLHMKARAQFEYKQDIVRSLDTLIAVNRLNESGHYSSDEPMPTSGDSGGPWIVEGEKGELHLVAITSLVERFYNKTRYWSFFNTPEPLADFPYVAYGIKLGHREVVDFLYEAVKQGADIQFSDKTFNFFGLGSQ
jgi:hypothetical protein